MRYIFSVSILLMFNSIMICQTLNDKNIFTNNICAQTQNRELTRSLESRVRQLLFIGEYKKALQIKDVSDYLSGFFAPWALPLITIGSEQSKDYSLVPAHECIIERSKKERIIIINENHHQPLHRVFTKSLLKDLYTNGYHYLAIETLNGDSLLNIDKYPKLSSGFYSSEPQYGDMIREALLIGYKLVAYEYISGGDNRMREYSQASAIKKKTLDIDPNAKVIVHCGYAHGMKSLSDGDTLMGGWIRLLTGINPLIINQVTLTEHSNDDYENIFYKTLICEAASVFINKGALYDLYKKEMPLQEYDINVIHPRTKYVYNRPDWLNMTGDKRYYFPNKEGKIKIEYPINVKAFFFNEKISEAVPVDCIELLSPTEEKAMLLKPGKYILIVTNDIEGAKESQAQQLEIDIK